MVRDPFDRSVEFFAALSNAVLRARVLDEDTTWEALPGWTLTSGAGLDLDVIRPLILVALIKHEIHGTWAVGLLRNGGREMLVQLRAAEPD